jgi:hypothetical protein
MTMQPPLSELTWESSIYPREHKNNDTVQAYAEALRAGAQFPPFKVQRVFNYLENGRKIEAFLVLDGVHHWHACKEVGIGGIEVVYWQPDRLDLNKFQQLPTFPSNRINENSPTTCQNQIPNLKGCKKNVPANFPI